MELEILVASLQKLTDLSKFFEESLVMSEIITNFAATVPTTPLDNAYHGGTSSFIKV